jgi:hypothetical protein
MGGVWARSSFEGCAPAVDAAWVADVLAAVATAAFEVGCVGALADAVAAGASGPDRTAVAPTTANKRVE